MKKTKEVPKNYISPKLPSGVKDILQLEAKELKSIKERLAKRYEASGFEEVFTPAFEYLDVLSLQAGARIKTEMFKFFDETGDLLALRPDMTISIARLVSQKLSKRQLPLRLSYQSNVFRQQKPFQGQPREFWQSGVELIGGKKVASDAEIIMLLIDALEGLNLKNFKVGIGSVGFVKTILEGFGEDSKILRKYLTDKNMVAVERYLSNSKKPAAKKLETILRLKGEKALNEAKKLVLSKKERSTLDELTKVATLLKKLGFDKYITYDFSLVPDFEYYTGIIFEVYVNGIGVEIASGGRYDNLLSNLGKPFNAAGFAIGLERLHLALVSQGKVIADRKTKVVLAAKPSAELFKYADVLRANNFLTNINTEKITDYQKLLKDTGAKYVIEIKDSVFEITGLKAKKSLSLNGFKRWIKNV